MKLVDLLMNVVNKWVGKQPKKVFRSSLVKMFYTDKPTRRTPKPFLELRVFVISKKPIPNRILAKRMLRELDWLEFVMSGTRTNKFQQKRRTGEIQDMLVNKGKYRLNVDTAYGVVRYEIIGSEVNRPIDIDEAVGSIPYTEGEGLKHGAFATTGLSPDEWEYNRIYRYACFFRPNGKIKKEYNEKDIRQMEGTAGRDYNEWLYYLESNEDFRREFMKENMLERGYEWKEGYRVTRLFFWRGRPVVRVLYKGKFVKGGFWMGRKPFRGV